MDSVIFPWNEKHRDAARKLKGDMTFDEHYAYLLEWYMRDRKGHLNQAPEPGYNYQNITQVTQDNLTASLHDVVDSLKHLDSKIERVHRRIEKHGHVAKKEIMHETPSNIGQSTSRAKENIYSFGGNVFTRLVDKRRFERVDETNNQKVKENMNIKSKEFLNKLKGGIGKVEDGFVRIKHFKDN